MNLITKKVEWANWQFSILKLALISFGILLGAYFPTFWREHFWWVRMVFIVTVIWSTVMWVQAMRK